MKYSGGEGSRDVVDILEFHSMKFIGSRGHSPSTTTPRRRKILKF